MKLLNLCEHISSNIFYAMKTDYFEGNTQAFNIEYAPLIR